MTFICVSFRLIFRTPLEKPIYINILCLIMSKNFFKKIFFNKISYCSLYVHYRDYYYHNRDYYWYRNICIYNSQSCYETSRQNEKEQNVDIIKVLILLRLLLRFMWLQALARVWHFLLAFFINVLIWKWKFCFLSRWISSSFALCVAGEWNCSVSKYLKIEIFSEK